MNAFFSDALVRALGWTLVHSLWQGALIALTLWVVWNRLPDAARRYQMAYGALTSVLLTALGTFAWMYKPAETGNLLEAQTGVSIIHNVVPLTGTPDADCWTVASAWLEAHYSLIVTLWLLGFGFFLLRLWGGLRFVRRLRQQSQSPTDPVWMVKVTGLAQQLRLKRPVALLESVLVHAPLTIGWLKPLILLPIGLLNQLSPAEVEAVLAHELAHIARRDWLFNLVQAFIEALFYYHPAVWWISERVRTERENCCDDAAVRLTDNRLLYAKALVRVQEMARPALLRPSPALGMDGHAALWSRRAPLLERIRRVLNQPQPKSHIMEKIIATAILLAILTAFGIRANTAVPAAWSEFAAAQLAWIAPAPDFTPVPDSVPKSKNIQRIIREDDGKRVEMEVKNGEVTRLKINDKEYSPAEIAAEKDLTDELMRVPPPPPPFPAMPPPPPFPARGSWNNAPAPPPPPPVPAQLTTAKDADGNTIIRIERNGKPTQITVKDGEVWVDGRKMAEGESLDMIDFENNGATWNDVGAYAIPDDYRRGDDMRAIDAEIFAQHQAELAEVRTFEYNFDASGSRISKKDMKRMQKDMKRAQKELEKAQKDLQNNQRTMKLQQEIYIQRQMELSKSDDTYRDVAKEWAEAPERPEARVRVERVEIRERPEPHEDQYGNMLEAQLLQEGLINADNYSVSLSKSEMRINGKVQPAEVLRRYLALYQRTKGKPLGDKERIEIEKKNE